MTAVADFADPLDVKVVELDEACRRQQVADGCFTALDQVPRRAITLTVPRLLAADRLFCVVPGARKREAVRRALRATLASNVLMVRRYTWVRRGRRSCSPAMCS